MENQQIVLARDAEIGGFYRTAEMNYKVKIAKKFGDEKNPTSVLIEVEHEAMKGKTVNISPHTKLIGIDEYDQEQNRNLNKGGSSMQDPAISQTPETPEAPVTVAAVKEVKSKMSDLITPMLMAGKSAEEIADAVVLQFPEKAEGKTKLIQQIKGPRTFNLVKALEKAGKEVPEHLKKAPKAEAAPVDESANQGSPV